MENQEIMIPQENLLKVNFKAENFKFENQSELEKMVNQIHEKYKNLIVTEEDIAESKKTRVDINKIKNAINSERLKVEREYNEPLEGFKKVVKGFVQKLDNSAKSIDDGIKFFENKERQQKAERINQIVDEIAKENDVEPSKIAIQARWSNKTTTLKSIKSDIEQEIKEIKEKQLEYSQKVEAIKKQCEREGLDPYAYLTMAETFPLTQILSGISADADVKKAQEKRLEQLKEERIEREKSLVEQPKKAEAQQEEIVKETQISNIQIEKVAKEKIQQVGFTIQGTEKDINAIAEFILDHTNAKVVNHTDRKYI